MKKYTEEELFEIIEKYGGNKRQFLNSSSFVKNGHLNKGDTTYKSFIRQINEIFSYVKPLRKKKNCPAMVEVGEIKENIFNVADGRKNSLNNFDEKNLEIAQNINKYFLSENKTICLDKKDFKELFGFKDYDFSIVNGELKKFTDSYYSAFNRKLYDVHEKIFNSVITCIKTIGNISVEKTKANGKYIYTFKVLRDNKINSSSLFNLPHCQSAIEMKVKDMFAASTKNQDDQNYFNAIKHVLYSITNDILIKKRIRTLSQLKEMYGNELIDSIMNYNFGTHYCPNVNTYSRQYHQTNQSDKIYCVYRFLDANNKVIYVGKTSRFNKRIKEHFSSNGHLQMDCYINTLKVEYTRCQSSSDMTILEAYYIGKYLPFYNTREKEPTSIKCAPVDTDWIKYKPFDSLKEHFITSLLTIEKDTIDNANTKREFFDSMKQSNKNGMVRLATGTFLEY